MSNYGYAAAVQQHAMKKVPPIGSSPTLMGRLTNYLRKNSQPNQTANQTAGTPLYDVPLDSVFRGDFTGWQFRMHKAVGGIVLEAWRNDYNLTKGIGTSHQDHELFIINNSEDLSIELPQILTQLALRY